MSLKRTNQFNIPTEAQEAKMFIAWGRLQPLIGNHLIHIPNGGYRTPYESIDFKKQGVLPGVSDYFLAVPISIYHGLWIELKRQKIAKPQVTRTQKQWLDQMKNMGYASGIAYGALEAVEMVTKYMDGDFINL